LPPNSKNIKHFPTTLPNFYLLFRPFEEFFTSNKKNSPPQTLCSPFPTVLLYSTFSYVMSDKYMKFSSKSLTRWTGVLAHRCGWTHYERCILNAIQNIKNFRKKIICVHRVILCLHIKFHGKRKFLGAHIKIQKCVSWKAIMENRKLSFLHKPQKSFFMKLCVQT
jgi:hypothetical protein